MHRVICFSNLLTSTMKIVNRRVTLSRKKKLGVLNYHSNKIGKGEKSDANYLSQWDVAKYSLSIKPSVITIRLLL